MSHTFKANYTLNFSPIQNTNGTVCLIDHCKHTEYTIGINIDDQEFKNRQQSKFPTLIADLVDLAVAIHGADRLIQQPFDQEPCQINVCLPVRHPDLLNAQSFRETLENLMNYTTGSNWAFNFKQRIGERFSVEQNNLFEFNCEVTEVGLWSGGLDALAGLYTRLGDNLKASFVLCGTGSNDKVFDYQHQTFNAVNFLAPNRLTLYRIPIRLSNSKTYKKNNVPRARGVVFMLIGSACAYLMGKRILNVYENGIGAINLPYRRSALGLDHSRSVHPKTLLMVSNLISSLLKETFKIQNPFLFWTKAQMCQALAQDSHFDLPSLTKSCDRPYHQNPSQCGYCSSCLLRKQALAAARITDQTPYVVSSGNFPSKTDSYLFFNNMLEQVKTFHRLLSIFEQPSQQWAVLTSEFPQLDFEVVDSLLLAETNLIPPEVQKFLLKLYKNYVKEWDLVESQIKISLIPKVNNLQITSKPAVIIKQS